MKPKEISQLIEKEIAGDWSLTNLHGCDLKKCLIRPKRRKVGFYSKENWILKEVWVVLEENPETLRGQMVIFDEEDNKFGLAEHREPFDFALNTGRSFIEAFKSM